MAETTLTYLDGYCERAGQAGLWAEPLGLVTNAAFLVAAWLAWRNLPSEQRSADRIALILLLAAIGIGSGLWHSFATGWALLGDVIPILIFINLYLLVFFRRVLKMRWIAVVVGWLVFQGANMASELYLPRDTLNGSIMYVPTLLTLGCVIGWLHRIGHPATRSMLVTLGIFTLSLIFRTLDGAACGLFPFGLHAFWHILNAVVLYRLIVELYQKKD